MSSPKTAAPSEAEIIAKEKAAWDSIKNKDYDAFGKLLASDYIEVNDEGVFDKAGIIAVVKDFVPTDISYSDWKTLPIDDDAVMLTYNLTVKATYKGKEVPAVPHHAASVWAKRDGQWLAFFYQQTPVKTAPPPPPAPSPGKTDKAAATPAAKSVETGSDPIANEKMVWDSFKAKNYDAFAAMLDPAFVEIESISVYDKAASVKGAAEFDASQMDLSEWKAAKVDNDAALVTYLVKPHDPKFDSERHSTIWASRGGKWVALLHIGTPVAKAPAK